MPNLLFIMCDQLRADYLGCYGHSAINTPHIDALAHNGVRFERAYVQSPICGPSRMSTYTGRYVASHGATVNFASLRVDEMTLADYLTRAGIRTAVAGKTHIKADHETLRRLGVSNDNLLAHARAEGGFEAFYRDDGVHLNDARSRNTIYNRALRNQGYLTDNPWHTHANSVLNPEGQRISGWVYESAPYPADIQEAHSETSFTTRQAIAFIEEAGVDPWCLHLSFIKPHWPYVVPAPYHAIYTPADTLPVKDIAVPPESCHPVHQALQQSRVSKAFAEDAVRRAVIPAYMGLIQQIDDQIGILVDFLKEKGLFDDTVIVFTSDHGDHLGDHGLGEKDSLFEETVRVPLIIADPRSYADATRGNVIHDLVESIDLLPTFLELTEVQDPSNRLEGRSLVPYIVGDGSRVTVREFVVAELDYSHTCAREHLGLAVDDCRATMIRTPRWKYIHYVGLRPQLFDLENDPAEQYDCAKDRAYEPIIADLKTHLLDWSLARKNRVTITDEHIDRLFGGDNPLKRGLYLGFRTESELSSVQRNMDADHGRQSK